jgi:RNA recognition motif-containing protein
MAIKIMKLPLNLSDEEIKTELEKLFSPYGAIEFRRPIENGEDGDTKVAYISLGDEASEERAVDELDRTTTELFPLPIRLGISRPPGNLGGGQMRGGR